MAAAVKNAARVYHQAWRMNFSRNNALGLNLDAALGEDHAVVAACNYYAIAFDLTFDLGVLPEDERLFGDDVSFHVSINTKRASHGQRAFHRDALVYETSPLFAAPAFR